MTSEICLILCFQKQPLSIDILKGRYIEERLESNSCLAPLTSIVEKKNTMEVNGAKVPIVFYNFFLCVQQKKETHTGLQQLDRISIFGWSIPFKKVSRLNIKT